MCVLPLSKIHDFTDKFTCQSDISSLFTDSNILQNSPTGQFQSNHHIYSPFSMWEVKMKTVTSIHVSP